MVTVGIDAAACAGARGAGRTAVPCGYPAGWPSLSPRMNILDFPTIVLASGSPRRRELLQQLGVPHVVLAVDIDETPLPGEPARQLVTRLAVAKAQAGLLQEGLSRPVLGSDTVVAVDGTVHGKPVDRADGLRMLAA